VKPGLPGLAHLPAWRPSEPVQDPESLPTHVTTPLLTLITQRSLDEDYAAAAARRAEAGEQDGERPSFRWATALAVLVFAMVATVIGLQTQRDAEVDELSRAALVDQAEQRREQVAALQSRVRSLEVSNREALQRSAALGSDLERVGASVEQLELVTGFSAVRGPGVRIRLDNPPGATPNSEMRDEDLATLVDGLWAAGAEAISVNGERLTATTGIRNTSRAIHIGGRPVSAPYEVLAIGDPGTLQADLLASSQGQVWFQLVQALGFVYEPENVSDLELPAARLVPPVSVQEGSAAYRSGTLYGEEEKQ